MPEIRKIKISDKEYPPLLKEIQNPPQELFVRGALPDADKICIAIVGTRKATSEGRALAKKIAKLCAEKGFVVVSGLAMGIDAAAHEGALEGGGEMIQSGSPRTTRGELCRTIAVLGCGIDKIYPAHNENLGRKIETHGAIISEYPVGTPAYQSQFLERNRIVAGLSIATIVIEAPAKSGALVTARLAAESGREVLVFPGAAGHPQYRGSHALIRDGARLVNSFEDIMEDLEPVLSLSAYAQPTPKLFDLEEQNKKISADPKIIFNAHSKPTPSIDSGLILRLLEGSKIPLSVDKISELTHLSPQAVNQELGELIIKRIIEEDGLGYRIIKN